AAAELARRHRDGGAGTPLAPRGVSGGSRAPRGPVGRVARRPGARRRSGGGPALLGRRASDRRYGSRLSGCLGGGFPRCVGVGVHLGAASGPAKVWARERVVEFCRRGPARGVVPVLLGAPSDAPAAADVLRQTRAVSLVGRDGPDLLPAVLTEIAVLVSGDTGVAHLAAALGTPVVALFGPTDPALTAPIGGVAVVRHAVPCAPCFYRRCPIDHPCMRGIL